MKGERKSRNGRAVLCRILVVMLVAACASGSLPQAVLASGGITDTTMYGCRPVSEDLSMLPAMENRVYAEWEGSIYYRQYSDEDLEEGALWGDFSEISGTAKELMRIEPDGSVTQVGVDYGYGGLAIVNGRIYSQKYEQKREDGKQSIRSVVYSCATDGSDVKEYSAHRMLAVRGGKIICETGGYGDGAGHGIAWIDGEDGQEHILISGNDMYPGTEYLEATEKEIFFSKLVGNTSESGTVYDLTLYSVDYQGNTKDLATVTMQEYRDCMTEEWLPVIAESPLYIPCLQILEDDLYFSVGTTNGTAHMYSGGMICRVKKDGSGLTRLVDASFTERFYLYDDGKDRVLFCRLMDEKTGRAADGMQQVVLRGKTVDDIVMRDADQTYFDRPHGYVAADGADVILFYPDTSGVCYVLLSEKESKELGIRTHRDGHMVQQITDIEYLGGKLFFTVTDLTYSQEYCIGWRDGYERGESVCYCKDIASGEIRVLYRY